MPRLGSTKQHLVKVVGVLGDRRDARVGSRADRPQPISDPTCSAVQLTVCRVPPRERGFEKRTRSRVRRLTTAAVAVGCTAMTSLLRADRAAGAAVADAATSSGAITANKSAARMGNPFKEWGPLDAGTMPQKITQRVILRAICTRKRAPSAYRSISIEVLAALRKIAQAHPVEIA